MRLQEILFSLKTEILLRFRSNYVFLSSRYHLEFEESMEKFLLTRMISRLNVDGKRLLKILQNLLVRSNHR